MTFDLVCIPFHDYKVAYSEGFRTRDTHLYKHFICNDRLERVVLLNRPTLGIECLLGKKAVRSKGRLIYSRFPWSIVQTKDGFFVVDVFDFSVIRPVMNRKGFLPDLYLRNLNYYQAALSHLNVNNFATYESSPLTVRLSLRLNSKYRILDGVDNLCKHTTYSKYANQLRQLYQAAFDGYDLIVFNSRSSIDYFSLQRHENVHFVPNGVDSERFRDKFPIPKQLENIRRPIIMYAGKMQNMFDCPLVKELAVENPECSFVFLGKILEGDIKAKFKRFDNVHFFGDVPYDDLPGFVTNADICIIPYVESKQHGGDPIKFYEFMAANKPIVSTNIGEIKKYHNGVHINVVAREKFSLTLKRILQSSNMPPIHNDIPDDMSWLTKANWFIEKIGILK